MCAAGRLSGEPDGRGGTDGLLRRAPARAPRSDPESVTEELTLLA
jgi:hypothetical protein